MTALLILFTNAGVLMASEVNVYSYRQPDLIKPLTDKFTQQTGIKVNVAYLKKGMIERMKAEGKRSPADVVLTVDISRLAGIVSENLTQPVQSSSLSKNVPELYRDPDNHWFGLTTRARIVYASKDRVSDGEIETYEELADPNGLAEYVPVQGQMLTMLPSLRRLYIISERPQLKNGWRA